MKHFFLYFSLLVSFMGNSQTWHSYNANNYHPYYFWTAGGYPHKQFKINHYDNSIWLVRDTNIFRIDNNGEFTLFNANNESILEGFYAFEDMTFTPTRTVLVDRYYGLINYNGTNWSFLSGGVDGVTLSSDEDTIWCARIDELYVVNSPLGTQFGNVTYLRRIVSRNGNHWATAGIDDGVLFHFQNGSPVMYNADTIPFLLDNVNYHFKFSKYTDTLYTSGNLGISLAVGNSFVDTITPNNSINMPSDLIVTEFEIDPNNNIWAVFGENSFYHPPKKIGFFDRNMNTWTLYDEINSPVVFSNGSVGIELDTLGNIWVVNKQLLHVLTTGTEPSWLGNSELTNNNSFKIYPNPSAGIVNLELDNKLSATSIEITDLTGRIVKTLSYSPQINLDLEVGQYFVRILDDSSIIGFEKIIIE